MKKIKDFLGKFGLTDIETEIYLSLLQSGPSSVLEISKKTKVKRSTVHINVESLIQKGLISQTKEGARRKVLAEPPEHLSVIIEGKKNALRKLENNFPDFISNIRGSLAPVEDESKVDVRYYEGKNAVMQIYYDALRAKEFRAYVNSSELAKRFPDNIKLFLETHNKREDMKIWEIMDDNPSSRDYVKSMPSERYRGKFVPENVDLSVVDYMIFDNKVAIVDLRGDTSGIVIHNKHYYENAKAIFNFVWQVLP